MRFGHFFYPMNLDPSQDYHAIEDCILEAELVEQLGFDAIWISEHHFAGEAVYGDPLVFAAAVAVKTQRVLLGLGIVEMALFTAVSLVFPACSGVRFVFGYVTVRKGVRMFVTLRVSLETRTSERHPRT